MIRIVFLIKTYTMKNLLRAIPLIMIMSCQTQVSSDAGSIEEDLSYEIQDTAPAMYAISYDTALKDMNYYDSLSKATLGVDPVRAFTIRSVDLVESIGLPVKYLKKAKYSHVRIYMGLDESTREFKIFLTPVEGANLSKGIAGKDVILDGPYTGARDGVRDGIGDGDGQYVLDFSKPCPATCP